MKIVSLEASNVKRLSAVHIKPDGSLVIIGGRNAQGKTSVLDSIVMALGGTKNAPEKPIRAGQKEAEIRLDLGELVVVRKFSEKTGGSLTVTDGASGVKITSPQTILDKLTAKIAFDPLAFSRMVPLAQFEELRKLLGLDFAGMDAERLKIYNERTVKNREVESQSHRVRQMPHHANAPDKAPDASEVAGRLEQANKWNKENADASEQLSAAQDDHEAASMEITRLQQLIEVEERKKARALEIIGAVKDTAGREDVDTTAISEELAGLAETRSQVEANQRRAMELGTMRDLEKAARDMTTKIEEIDAKKAKMIEEAEFPVEGLGFTDNAVTFNALPFGQASAAEQLRVSVAMGIAMNPKLKVLLIRDGSLLDEENLGLIAAMADKAGAQVWIERVGKGDAGAVIIEDGHVQEVKPAAKKEGDLI
jgi:hypothetical protein